MEKSNQTQKDISYVLDIRTIPADGLNIFLKANPSECLFLAKRYDLPAVCSISVDVNAKFDEEIIEIKGFLKAKIKQRCVVTLDIFEQSIEESFKVFFSNNPRIVADQESKSDFNPDEEPIELVQKGRIYFKELIAEQLGLYIDPFPKKTKELFTYYEEKSQKENPFSALKHLTKL